MEEFSHVVTTPSLVHCLTPIPLILYTFSSVQSRNGALADGISRRPLAGLRNTWASSKLPDRFPIFDTVARRRPRNQKSVFTQYLRNRISWEAKIFRVDRDSFVVPYCQRNSVSDFYFRSDGRSNFLRDPNGAKSSRSSIQNL